MSEPVAAAVAVGSSAAPRPRVAVVGISVGTICGVRDHARILAGALEQEGFSCSTHWLYREQDSLRGAIAEVGEWTRHLRGELEREQPTAVLFHYSVFTYSHRGIPLFTLPVLRAAGRSGAGLVSVMHEFVYPWGRNGARGAVWAVTQRAVLIDLVRRSEALLVTIDSRAEWLSSRRWLARRRLAVAPVFSNLPAAAAAPGHPEAPSLGLFGFAHEGIERELVLDAFALLRRQLPEARLRLLGSPGADSDPGREWLAAAERRGIASALDFSGRLEAQELADALAGCTLLLCADEPGPTSRKGTLAASLAAGRPLVAIDGPRSWPALVQAGAAAMVAPEAGALAERIGQLLADPGERDALAQRAGSFYASVMSARHTSRAVSALIAQSAVR